MAQTLILPAVRDEYIDSLKAYNETDGSNVKTALDMLHDRVSELAGGLVAMQDAIKALRDAVAADDPAETIKRMTELRKAADAMETVVPSGKWPLPKYQDMLFVY